MNWFQPVNDYCERIGPGLWTEPVNAVSNAAFLLAAISAYVLWRRQGRYDKPILLLIVLTFAIGAGSFLFHIYAVRWAWFADVVPISLFIAGYLMLALVRFIGLRLAVSLVALIAFEIVTVFLLYTFPDFLNRSAGYFPALATLLLLGIILVAGNQGTRQVSNSLEISARNRSTGRALLLAAVLFTLSLIFRIADLAICQAFPLGTHFLWHVFNALVLHVLLRAAILHRKPVDG